MTPFTAYFEGQYESLYECNLRKDHLCSLFTYEIESFQKWTIVNSPIARTSKGPADKRKTRNIALV